MSARFSALAFGPGFNSKGSPIEVEASALGLRLMTAEDFDGQPAWSDIKLERRGFNASQLALEWQGKAGRYVLMVSDAASVAALKGVLPSGSKVGKPGQDTRTRAWSQSMMWLTFGLPLVLVIALLLAADPMMRWAVSHISIERETQLGEVVFSQVKQKLRPVDVPAKKMVDDLGARLTKGSKYKYQFMVADDPAINAFAMPGGFIVMHSALIAKADSAEEVAGVLAHEIAHVENRHSLRAMAKAIGLAGALTVVFGDIGGATVMATELLNLKHSRDHETEADRDGLQLLVKHGISPNGLPTFFKKLAEEQKLNLGFLSTHPGSADRAREIEVAIAALPEAARKAPPLAIDFAAVKASLPKPVAAPSPPTEPSKK
jgi:beta-barrel assembly-enhancing protease